jgi:glycerol uptake facilitator-like aquaporin
MTHLLRKSLSEFLGTAILLVAVVGSSFMGSFLTQDALLGLFVNAFATLLALGCVIFVFGAISGGYFNPVVTFAEFVVKRLEIDELIAFIIAQLAGAFAGVVLANYMFKQHLVTHSTIAHKGMNLYVAEVLATAGLIIILQLLIHQYNDHLAPIAIPAWIGGAYLFTASTAFANPAAVFGRMWTNAGAGIDVKSGLAFIGAEVLGAMIGIGIVAILTAGDDDLDGLAYLTEEEYVEVTDHSI